MTVRVDRLRGEVAWPNFQVRTDFNSNDAAGGQPVNKVKSEKEKNESEEEKVAEPGTDVGRATKH